MGTKDRAEAKALLNARNESVQQPQLNRQIAQAYLSGTDSGVSTRTWRDAFDAIIEYKKGTTKDRWERGARQQAFGLIHKLVIIETQSEQLLACMKGDQTQNHKSHHRLKMNFLKDQSSEPADTDTAAKNSMRPSAVELMREHQHGLPVWVRAPKRGHEHYSGCSRPKLYE